ncbi:MAG: hypothetical protein AAF488_07650 [Planctomycetota bacterium]
MLVSWDMTFELSGIRLNPELSEDAFLSSSAGSSARELVRNGFYRSYASDEPVLVFGRPFSPTTLWFVAERLESVSLTPAGTGSSWSDYSEATDSETKTEIDAWLKEQFGSGVRFSETRTELEAWLEEQFGSAPYYVFEGGTIEPVWDLKTPWVGILVRFRSFLRS